MDYLELPGGRRHYIQTPRSQGYTRATDSILPTARKELLQPTRDEKRGFIVMPLLASRIDDWFLSAVAKGTVTHLCSYYMELCLNLLLQSYITRKKHTPSRSWVEARFGTLRI